LALTNVTGEDIRLEIPVADLGVEAEIWWDLLGEKHWEVEEGKLSIPLRPYDVVWLKPAGEVEGTGWI
jgi:hypothetical protein